MRHLPSSCNLSRTQTEHTRGGRYDVEIPSGNQVEYPSWFSHKQRPIKATHGHWFCGFLPLQKPSFSYYRVGQYRDRMPKESSCMRAACRPWLIWSVATIKHVSTTSGAPVKRQSWRRRYPTRRTLCRRHRPVAHRRTRESRSSSRINRPSFPITQVIHLFRWWILLLPSSLIASFLCLYTPDCIISTWLRWGRALLLFSSICKSYWLE